ncbi:hypothetical protein MNV49_005752 [Pseudohyphozyma bogoriensis]|nr:hypothetical protein MNV49_005752 [Pseudohyphozyma bogoriensis]
MEVDPSPPPPPPSPTSQSASQRLPPELLKLIFDACGDYELATTLGAPHSIQITSPWVEQATPLDRAILHSGNSVRGVESAVRDGHTRFTQWGARVMIRFSYLHLLAYFLQTDPSQLREQCQTLLPVVASAWGRVEVLKWATESKFGLRPDRSTMAEAMDDASRHGQVEVLEFWKKSGLPLHYSEHSLSSATVKAEIGSLEWWKRSGLPLKIYNVLDFASMEGTTKTLDWWSQSGLPAPYSKAALYHLSRTGNVPLLDWWKSSRFSLLYDKEVLIIATRHSRTSVLSWWKESGLDIEYRFFDIEEALEDSVGDGEEKERTQEWWEREAGYDVGLGTNRNQRQLLELQKLPGNDVCADCKARNPRWASWDLGIFLCLQCAGLHRKMGTHISKVKSLTMDTWTREQVDHMRANGNLKSNYYFNPDDRLNPPPASVDEGEKEWQLERFIRDKYEYKAFIGATPLGPPPVAPVRAPSPSPSATSPSSFSFALPSPTTSVSSAPRTPTHASTLPLPAIPPPPQRSASPAATRAPSSQLLPPSSTNSSPESVKHVRFRASSVPIPDVIVARVPSASLLAPAKGILRPSSSSSANHVLPEPPAPGSFAHPNFQPRPHAASWSVGSGGMMSGANGAEGGVGGSGGGLFAGLPMRGNSPFAIAPQATGAAGAGTTNGVGVSTNPFHRPPSASPAPVAPPPQAAPAASFGSIWDNLDSLGAPPPNTSSFLSPSSGNSTFLQPQYTGSVSSQKPFSTVAAPFLTPQHTSSANAFLARQQHSASPALVPSPSPSPSRSLSARVLTPQHTSTPSPAPNPTLNNLSSSTTSTSSLAPPPAGYTPPAPLRPQQTGFIPSSAFGQQLAAEGAGGASSSGYKPPEPLRPQQTGFVPSSAFGQQLQNEGGGGAGGSMGGEYKQPEPLRPQPTGFVPSSRFGQQLAREQQHGAVGTAGGLGTSTSSFGASSSNTTNNALPSSPFSLNPIANVPSPSPSAMLYASPVSSPSASLSTTNPFYSSFSMSGMNASLPARAPSAGGGGMGTPIGMGGGTNPFFNTAPVGGLKPQATGYGYGQGFLGGPSPTASGYGTPTGQQGNQGVNPFFGGGTANVSAGGMGEFGQLPRHWG